MRLRVLFVTLLSVVALVASAADVVWFDGHHPVTYQVVGKVDPVVKIALQMFESDIQMVTGMKPVASKSATIRVVQGKGSDDGFRISINAKKQIVIEGHNGRGAAY